MRKTPLHEWAEELGAVFVETGLWLRSSWFPLADEKDWLESVTREVKAARERVGLCDVSTLGKIDVQGPDAARIPQPALLQHASRRLHVGKARYGLMLREDGIVFDDGTTSRLAADHYLHDDDHGQCGPRHVAYGILPSGLVARARCAICLGHRAMGADGGRRTQGARDACRRSSTTSTLNDTTFPYLAAKEITRARRHPGAAVPHLVFRRACL